MPFRGFFRYFSGLFPNIPKTQKRKEGLKMNYRKTFNRITLIAWSTIAVIFCHVLYYTEQGRSEFTIQARGELRRR